MSLQHRFHIYKECPSAYHSYLRSSRSVRGECWWGELTVARLARRHWETRCLSSIRLEGTPMNARGTDSISGGSGSDMFFGTRLTYSHGITRVGVALSTRSVSAQTTIKKHKLTELKKPSGHSEQVRSDVTEGGAASCRPGPHLRYGVQSC